MQKNAVTLRWNNYTYFPYEKIFAQREISSLLSPITLNETDGEIQITGKFDKKALNRLVYFKEYQINGSAVPTLQSQLESSCATNGKQKRQSTRYSVHGLHEYKGKFNPQVVRGVLNLLGVSDKANVLDPFSGSGTTLVECAHAKIKAVGWDINPLAVYIANAKLKALSTPANDLQRIFTNLINKFKDDEVKIKLPIPSDDERAEYLWSWFDKKQISEIERLRTLILKYGKDNEEIFLALASDLLRDYSLQEPTDLRIRRRFSPYPDETFFEAYQKKTALFINNLIATQKLLGVLPHKNHAYLLDSRKLENVSKSHKPKGGFQAAITSPPYATALPYIDTQRLSLVWLGLISPKEISNLEAKLTGSREFAQEQKKLWSQALQDNTDNLPKDLHQYCMTLHQSLSSKDGFRRQSTPMLLYRYLSDMKKTFETVIDVMATSAPFALIVGHNRTILSGKEFDIDTPSLLKTIAEEVGWKHKESTLLQTYQRYGLHSSNAVKAETLLIVEKP